MQVNEIKPATFCRHITQYLQYWCSALIMNSNGTPIASPFTEHQRDQVEPHYPGLGLIGAVVVELLLPS